MRISELKELVSPMRGAYRQLQVWNDYNLESERLLGEITRNAHSIEKGLSLDNIRLGFGLAKIKETFENIKRLFSIDNTLLDLPDKPEPVIMFVNALKAYLIFHENINYNSSQIDEIKNIYQSLINMIPNIDDCQYGGIIEVERDNYIPAEQEIIGKLFNNRHSIREFDKSPVDDSNLKKAIELALRCPSACNRQCQRLYIVEKEDFHILNNWFDGVGGFSAELDKMLFVTGKVSVYRKGEWYQWIVTSSIFAGYLTLALETFNIGCCVIQRPVLPDKQWESLGKILGAQSDEQLVCCLGIGNFKREYKVPVSHRFEYHKVVKTYKKNESNNSYGL